MAVVQETNKVKDPIFCRWGIPNTLQILAHLRVKNLRAVGSCMASEVT